MPFSGLDAQPAKPGESLLTHPSSQLRLAAEMPWWGWLTVAACLAMCGLLIWYLWPKKPKDPFAGVARDADGKPVPPWKQTPDSAAPR
ncbi:MAG TPA: hypothetical protein P5137_03110 [Candidatus Brocadiia bacterium]|nr:hypothetical protein [Candidatus Brocadiia bacterium]